MKILLVTDEDPGNPYGGLGTFVREIAKGLRKLGHQTEVLFLQSLENRRERGSSSSLVKWTVSSENSKQTIHHVQSILAEFVPDIIHCNDQGTWAPFRDEKNVVFSVHLSVPDLVGLRGFNQTILTRLETEREACDRSAAVIVYSKYYQKRVLKNISFKADPIVLPLGVQQNPSFPRKTEDKIIVSFFGRLVNFQKGVDEFVRAVESLDPDWVEKHQVLFRVYGHSSHKETTKRLTVRNISEVRFLLAQDLEDAYGETHIVLMPSRYEPFGLVGLEAFAHGCLLMAPTGLGMDEYFLPGKNGVEINANAQDIKNKLTAVIEDWESYRKLAEQGWKDSQYWSWKVSALEHEKLYSEVLNGRIKNRRFASCGLTQRMKVMIDFEFPLPEKEWGLNGNDIVVLPNFSETKLYKRIDGFLYFEPGEYLPFEDEEFTRTFLWVSPGYCSDPSLLFQEAARVCNESVVLCLPLGRKNLGQIWSADTWEEWAEGMGITKQWAPMNKPHDEWVQVIINKTSKRKAQPDCGLEKQGVQYATVD